MVELATKRPEARSGPRTGIRRRSTLGALHSRCALHRYPRSDAILRFALHAEHRQRRSWVDCERGVLYRRGRWRGSRPRSGPRPYLSRARCSHTCGAGSARAPVSWSRSMGSASAASRRLGARRYASIGHRLTATKHDLRHTAVTWAMQRGADKLGTRPDSSGLRLDMLESTYGHHHPDHVRSAVEAMERKV